MIRVWRVTWGEVDVPFRHRSLCAKDPEEALNFARRYFPDYSNDPISSVELIAEGMTLEEMIKHEKRCK
jgi:hypothetical protein